MSSFKYLFCSLLVIILCALPVNAGAKINSPVQASTTVKILAVMVEFQKDNDGVTVGDGTFGSIFTQDWGQKILDPLPHDTANYYEKHLLFAKNYYEKLSKGLTRIEYTVLPRKITLSKKMKEYSPAMGSTDFKPIGDMMNEVWQLVDADTGYKNIDFSQYQLFTIFHAGVGRDVSLPGSLGNERDIPSLYLGLKSLKSIYGRNYTGIPVRNSTYHIQNSMILPQTENRESDSYGSKYLTQMSFNGLIVANIGSYLDLPDLFDTKTGISAIGRFGLMDGQSIFSYGSAFLAEPSAWEKIQLGWVKPVEITPDKLRDFLKLHIKGTLSAGLSDTAVYKIRINSDEYFLIENRQRDANKDGAKITTFSEGTYKTLAFAKDTNGFYTYDTKSIYGIVTDVDEFDWALPGSGILIWHIDEKVIRENRDSNWININKNRRGVCLVEADGIKDIGNQFTSVLGDVITGEGSDEDFWFEGNTGKFFTNKFDPTTRPNTNSNDGSNSFIWMKNFSRNANDMSFEVKIGSDNIKPVFTKQIPVNSSSNYIISDTVLVGSVAAPVFCLQTGDSVFIYDYAGNLVYSANDFSSQPITFAGSQAFGIKDSLVKCLTNPTFTTLLPGEKITTPLTAIKQTGGWEGFVGTYSGKVYKINITSGTVTSSVADSGKSSYPVSKVMLLTNGFAYICQDNTGGGNYRIIDSYGANISQAGIVAESWAAAKSNGQRLYILLLKDNTFRVYENGTLLKSFKPVSANQISDFSVIDLKLDSNPYIVFESGASVYAYNIQGVLTESFPVETGIYAVNAHRPLAAYDDARNQMILYSLTAKGLNAVTGTNGTQVSGYPFAFTSNESARCLTNYNGKLHIIAFDTAGILSLWQLDDKSHLITVQGIHGNSSCAQSMTIGGNSLAVSSFLPKDRTYNYPNPVYGGITYIRTYVNEDARINVKIFDLGGDLVAQFSAQARGGMENECGWDVSKIQSGVYLAKVEAAGVSGRSESTIIKIAVVK